MSLAFGGGSGGGGGGRGFSYRSSHQQGQDGPNRRGRGQSSRRRPPRKHCSSKNKNKLQCAADIFVPHHLRSVLIGKGGFTIQSLIKAVCSSSQQQQQSSNAHVSIYVPPRRREHAQSLNNNNDSNENEEEEDDNRPVRIKAETVASLLHACWRILHVLVLNASSSSSKQQQRQRGGRDGTGDDDDDDTAMATMTSMACHVRIPSNGPSLMGRLACTSPFFYMGGGGGGQASSPQQQQLPSDHSQSNSSINSTTTTTLSVYCVQSFLDAQQVDTLVDNVRFANAAVTAQYETVYQDDYSEHDNADEHDRAAGHDGQPSSLHFVYGTAEQQPELLYEALQQATIQLWQQEQQQQLLLKRQQPSLPHHPQVEEESSLTVGTYNLLHPDYAERYHEAAGVDRILLNQSSSNWLSFRVAAIYRILLACRLDIYLLQEVDAQAFILLSSNDNDNNGNHHAGASLLKQQLLERYEFIHFVHPGRSANDSVALLIRKDRFVVLQHESIPFLAKSNQYDDDNTDTPHQQELQQQPQQYMCAAVVLVKDLKTQRRYRVASTHFCPNKARHAEQTLLEFLTKTDDASSSDDDSDSVHCDGIIWGGDCNNEYKSSPSIISPLFSAYTTIQDSCFHGKMMLKNVPDKETTNEAQMIQLTEQQGNDGPRHSERQSSLNLQQRRRCTRGSKCIDWIFFSTPNNKNNNSGSDNGGTTRRGRLQGCRSSISEAFVHATGRRLEPTGYPASDHLGEAVTLVYK